MQGLPKNSFFAWTGKYVIMKAVMDMTKIANQWKDYECLDAGDGMKLERWGTILLARPDPQVIWHKGNPDLWNNADAIYHRSSSGGGSWEYKKKIPKEWQISYGNLTFKVSPTNFKHTGLFPEQATNWDYIMQKVKEAKHDLRILNLFAYTGGATMAASYAGAKEVVHVDSSKGILTWAKENMQLSHLEHHTIRFLQDDCFKFIEREKRRGRTYHAIIMDPPSYGRGPSGETWKLEDNLYEFLIKVIDILDQDLAFLLINTYTTGLSPMVLENILKDLLTKKYPNIQIECGEIALPITTKDQMLPCGIYARCEIK